MLPFRTTKSKVLSSLVVGSKPSSNISSSVFGNLSSSNILYSNDSNSNQWGSAFTTVSAISGWKRADITTDQVGAISVGTTITAGKDAIAIIEQMLYSYKSPSFNSFDVAIASTVLSLGDTIAAGNRTATWEYGTLGNNNWTAGSIGVARETQGIVGGISYSTASQSVPHPNPYTYSTPTNLTFYLTGGQAQGSTVSTSQVYSWRHKIWYGKSTLTALTQYSDFSSTFSDLFTQGTTSFTPYTYSFSDSSPTPKYLYILTPSNPGNFSSSDYDYTKFKDTSTNLIWPFNAPVALIVNNVNSVQVTYKVYRSLNATGGAVSIATYT
jgi:hypothetical protein